MFRLLILTLGPRIRKTLSAVVAATVMLIAAPGAFAQATRTWVSGVGDDANPCSRTAPCKTLAGAISKTATGGEINMLDPGGFGAVTITKSITIDADGFNGGVLVAGTNGITISAPGASVVLRDLNIDGLGSGLDGVQVLAAKQVSIEHTRIYNFADNAVDFEPSGANSRLYVVNSELFNNSGNGVLEAPPTGASAFATLTGDEIDANQCGLSTSSLGENTTFTTQCGTNATGSGGPAAIASFDTTIGGSVGTAVLSNGVTASNDISGDRVVFNTTGLQATNSGHILSFSNNYVMANGTNGAPTATVSPMFRTSR